MSNAVHVEALELQRGAFRLGPCSFEVPANGRLAIVGPSGSGKTSLLRALAGLERPNAGTVRVGDTVVSGRSPEGRRIDVAPNARGFGLVFQDGALWPHMTAVQHLRYANPGLATDEAKALLARAGLEPIALRKPASMSGGEAQRLGLLRTLAANPRVLLLDEPLRSVDVHQRDGLVLLLRSLADERALTTILVTHDRDEALALADQLVVMRDGRIVERGPAERLLTEPGTAFTAAFLTGAACLPVEPTGPSEVDTPFGRFAVAKASTALRLALAPGDCDVIGSHAGTAGGGSNLARGPVVACLPNGNAFLVRVALGDQIAAAHATHGIRPGTLVELRLRRPPRLLPWDPESPS